MTGTHALGLFTDHASHRQARDSKGRFVRVRHSPERRAVLLKAAQLRAELGLPAHPRLIIGDAA